MFRELKYFTFAFGADFHVLAWFGVGILGYVMMSFNVCSYIIVGIFVLKSITSPLLHGPNLDGSVCSLISSIASSLLSNHWSHPSSGPSPISAPNAIALYLISVSSL